MNLKEISRLQRENALMRECLKKYAEREDGEPAINCLEKLSTVNRCKQCNGEYGRCSCD